MKTLPTNTLQVETTSAPLIHLTDIRVVTKRKTGKVDRKRFIADLDRMVASPNTQWSVFDQVCAEAGL